MCSNKPVRFTRSRQVCQECHNRKIKCDYEERLEGEPCSNCEAKGRQCEMYIRRPRGPNKPHIAESAEPPSLQIGYLDVPTADDIRDFAPFPTAVPAQNYMGYPGIHSYYSMPALTPSLTTSRTGSTMSASSDDSVTSLPAAISEYVPLVARQDYLLHNAATFTADPSFTGQIPLTAVTRSARSLLVCKECHYRKVRCDFAQRPAGQPCSNCRTRGDTCEVYIRRPKRARRQRAPSSPLMLSN